MLEIHQNVPSPMPRPPAHNDTIRQGLPIRFIVTSIWWMATLGINEDVGFC